MPRQVRCEIEQNAMNWGVSWHNVARGIGITTAGTTKGLIRDGIKENIGGIS